MSAPAQHPTYTSNFLANVFLTFVGPLLQVGPSLVASDLWPLRHDDEAETLTSKLNDAWNLEVGSAGSGSTNERPSFTRAWARTFLPSFVSVGLATWAKALFALAQSRIVCRLLVILRDPTESVWSGLSYVLLIGVLGMAAALADAWYWRNTWFHGRRWAVATLGVLYSKATRVRVDALSGISTGHVVSLASSDVERFLQVINGGGSPHLLGTFL